MKHADRNRLQVRKINYMASRGMEDSVSDKKLMQRAVRNEGSLKLDINALSQSQKWEHNESNENKGEGWKWSNFL